MTTQTFISRLFGGKDIDVTYDNVAGTVSILGQSVTLSSLPSALQAQWATAVASADYATGSRSAFGGDDISAAIGAILDNQSAWRNSVSAVLATSNQDVTQNIRQ